MDSPGDPWDGLVGDRLAFLERLAAEPADKPALVSDLECSRSTVDRAIRRLEAAGLVERGAEGYVTTAVGRVAARRHRAHLEDQRTVRAAQSLLSPLAPADAPDDVVFAGGTVTTEGAVERLLQRLRTAESYRVALPSLPDTRQLRLLHARVVRDGLDAELVVGDGLADRLRTEFPELTADLLAAESCAVRRGDTPAYGLVLARAGVAGADGATADSPAAGRETTAAVFTTDATTVRGVVENDAPTAVDRLRERFRRARETATVLAAPPEGHGGTSLASAAPDRSLSAAGLTRVDESYFADRTPEEPETAWRIGMELADVYYGYAVERPASGSDGVEASEAADRAGASGTADGVETSEAADRVETPGTLGEAGQSNAGDGSEPGGGEAVASDELVERLRSDGDAVVVGPSGVGKSTLCRRVACRWVDSDRGPVFYRTGTGTRDLVDAAAPVSDADGDVLVVVEDAATEEFLRFYRAVRDDSTVTVLGEARERAWAECLGNLSDAGLRDAAGRLAEYRPPPVDEATCERAVRTFETVTGREVPLSPATLFDRVENRDGLGEMLVLGHQIVSHTTSEPWLDDPVGVSALDADVRAAYNALADAGETALEAGLLTAALAAAGEPVTPALVHALGAGPDGDHHRVEAALDVLTGRLVVPRADGHRFRTQHRQWTVRFLEHALDRDERETVARFERALTALFALADDPDRQRSVEAWLGRDAGSLARLADGEAVDTLVERLFAVGTDDSSLAPLFGTDTHSGIDLPDACSLATALDCQVARGKMWYSYGDLDRAEREFEALCTRIEADEADQATQTAALAAAHKGAAEVAIDRGDVDGARDSLERALAAAVDGGHTRRAVDVHNSLANAAMLVDDYDAAEDALRAALERCEAIDPCEPYSDTLFYLAKLEHFRGDLAAAEEWLSEAVDLDRELGSKRNQSSSRKLLADIAKERGDLERAAADYRRSLELKREVRDRPGEAHTLYDFGELLVEQGERDAAEAALERGLELARDNGMERQVGRVHSAFGRLALDRGDPEAAADHYRTMRRIHERVDYPRGVASATAGLGDVASERGAFERARDRYEEALASYRDIDASGEVLTVLDCLVETCRELGDSAAALQWCEEAVALAEETGRQDDRSAFVDRCEELEQAVAD